ncbi:cytochrome b-c1 complex subunit 7 [Naematelia encephala]|uniref:Complex III subunit 7 n=1 Tax=Naematelia encephala TaxID=71784 RepID=A0A1Y2BEC0_9TREE|nr:cytochrome b-c1 complex subunit 7 [Naematelia encephala]
MAVGGALGYSLAPILKSRYAGIAKLLKPVANLYASAAGWRKMGLKYDDLIPEESDEVQRALSRLSPRESYDRVFRHRIAFQQSILHKPLPKDQWLPVSEDKRYLTQLIKNVEAEVKEREEWDSLIVERKKGH